MRILLAVAFALTACSCASQQPLVAGSEINAIERDYAAARACESRRGPIGALDYDAAASLVHAQTERTARAVAHARKDVAVFAASACRE